VTTDACTVVVDLTPTQLHKIPQEPPGTILLKPRHQVTQYWHAMGLSSSVTLTCVESALTVL
jgi:hypothetical protein